MSEGLVKLEEEEGRLDAERDEESGEVMMGGMGELELDILVEGMKKELKVECKVGGGMVCYGERFKEGGEVEGKL